MTELISTPLSSAHTSAATLNDRGLELLKSRAIKRALICFDQAIALDPNLAPAHFNRGNTLSTMEMFRESIPSYDRALALGLDIAGLHYRRGLALFELGRIQDALLSYNRALDLKPNMPMAIYSRGFLQQETGQLDKAKANYQRALAQMPNSPQARLSMGMVCLATGDWREGWKYYEARWDGSHETRKGRVRHPPTYLPQWKGERALEKSNLLVFTEQGLGDSLQFGRYLLLAAERFAKVSYCCPAPLVRLFRASFSPAIEILDSYPEDQSAWQWQCPIMSLPRAFDTTLENVPNQIPYLKVRPKWPEKWHNRLAEVAGDRLKIGLVWSGFKNHKSDAKRSIALSKFAPLLNQKGIAWVSLQKMDAAKPQVIPSETAGMIDWMCEINDFADTAGLVSQLDLVISIDTSVAHLAGAMGKPVWMLNRFESEWRWMRDREDSPWYPTMRIFNQKTAGDWEEVLSRVSTALATFSTSSIK